MRRQIMAKFICKNCNQRYNRAVIAATRLTDSDLKSCPFCGSLFTELIPNQEITILPGLKKTAELLDNLFDKPERTRTPRSSPAPISRNFIIWLLTEDGVEIRQKYLNTRFKAEDYLRPSPLGPDFIQIEYEVEGGSWNAAQIRKDRIVDLLITEGAVDCENIHTIPEWLR
jgi:hypothetical protein